MVSRQSLIILNPNTTIKFFEGFFPRRTVILFRKGISLYSQQKVRFTEYFEHFLVG